MKCAWWNCCDEALRKGEVTEADKEEAKPEEAQTTDEVAAASAGTAIAGASTLAATEVSTSGKPSLKLCFLYCATANIMRAEDSRIDLAAVSSSSILSEPFVFFFHPRPPV